MKGKIPEYIENCKNVLGDSRWGKDGMPLGIRQYLNDNLSEALRLSKQPLQRELIKMIKYAVTNTRGTIHMRQQGELYEILEGVTKKLDENDIRRYRRDLQTWWTIEICW